MTLRSHQVIHNLQVMINIEEVHLLKDTCLLLSRFIIANLHSEKAFVFRGRGIIDEGDNLLRRVKKIDNKELILIKQCIIFI